MNQTEPSWIRDVLASEIEWDPRIESFPENRWIGEVCAGETSHCEHCGAAFPMWPTKGWADHLVTAHGDALTIQARTGTALLCADELNEAQMQFFVMMFKSRVSLRRRANQLGYAKSKEEKRIHITN